MRGLLTLALGLWGCSSDPTCFVGDLTAQPEIEIVHRTASGTVAITRALVPLLNPPQGGKVLLVGVRAKNLDGCPLQISASLRDPCNDRVLALERRPVSLEASPDGWAAPARPLELDNFSNLPGCPRSDNDRPIADQPYLLRVTVTDKEGRTAEATRMIEPYCGAEPEHAATCACECRSRFDRGACKTTSEDSGVVPRTCQDGGI